MEELDPEADAPPAEQNIAAARVLLEHASRSWAAEEERARLIQRQQQLAVAVLLAATGAFFTVSLSLLKGREGVWFWIGLTLLGTALVAAGASFTRLIQSRRNERGFLPPGRSASARLILGEEAGAIDIEDEASSLNLCFQRTYNGSLDLHTRNDRREEEISLGTGNLVAALTLAFLGVLVLILSPTTPAS